MGGGIMGRFIDITGNRYGRLTVIQRCGTSSDNRPQWLCKCDCGNTVVVRGYQLKHGRTKSCGCYHREMARTQAKAKAKHNLSNTRIYHIWKDMLKRCYSEKHRGYKHYGGRGINVCNEWRTDFKSFYDWAINSGYSDKLSIDRINVNGNYEPGNCRWATYKEQANNTRKNHYITYNGETKTLTQWAEYLGIKHKTLSARINDYKWPIEKALTQKVKL
jgi:hypothetical protein